MIRWLTGLFFVLPAAVFSIYAVLAGMNVSHEGLILTGLSTGVVTWFIGRWAFEGWDES